MIFVYLFVTGGVPAPPELVDLLLDFLGEGETVIVHAVVAIF